MATWQYDLFVLPQNGVQRALGHQPVCLQSDQFDEIDWWEDTLLTSECENEISALLSPSKSWNEECLKTWGSEDGNCINVSHDCKRIKGVTLRIDVRNIDTSFLLGVVDLVKHRGCLLITSDMEVIDTDIKVLMRKVAESPAFRFVKDPVLFLEVFRTKNLDSEKNSEL